MIEGLYWASFMLLMWALGAKSGYDMAVFHSCFPLDYLRTMAEWKYWTVYPSRIHTAPQPPTSQGREAHG